jgi:hypothetical protein
MARRSKPPLQLPPAERATLDEALQRIKLQPGSLITGDLHQDLIDGRLQAWQHGIIVHATDRDGTVWYYKGRRGEMVTRERSEAAIFDTIEGVRSLVRRLNHKQFHDQVLSGLSLSFEYEEFWRPCERSYWETVTLREIKDERRWTCHVSKDHHSQGHFYVCRAELDRHYPAPQPQAEPQPSSTAPPKPKPKAARRGSAKQDMVLNIAKELYPDGYAGVNTGKLIKHIDSELRHRKLAVPGSRDTFLRALGRRKG